MKKAIVLAFILGVFLSACSMKKERITESVPQENWTTVRIENAEYVQAYTMDENGNFYTIEMSTNDSDALLSLNQYDSAGKKLHSMSLSATYPDGIQTMAYSDGKLYYAPRCWDGQNFCILYSCDVSSFTETIISGLSPVIGVTRIVPMGEQIYLLGSAAEDSFSHSQNYSYDGRRLYSVNKSGGVLQSISIEEPIDMAKAGENRLLMYAHTEEDFSFLLYETEREAFSVKSITKECILSYFAYDPEKDLIAYDCEARGMLMCALPEKPEEASEIYPECDARGFSLICVNGKVMMRNFANDFVTFRLSEVKKEKDTIQYISDIQADEAPFGCGFTLQHMQYTTDKLAVKVLAQDKDYDICYFNTARTIGSNLKEKGMFYPLNDVPGVKEFLDLCYPYVKDAVTDSDGAIWMLPVQIDIPFVFCNIGHEKAKEFPFGENMTYEMFFAAQKKLTEQERSETAIFALPLFFMWNYFSHFRSVDTAEFRNLLSIMKDGNKYIMSSVDGSSTDYFYRVMPTSAQWYNEISVVRQREKLRAYPYPKLYPEDKNLAACYGIVVNPYSTNLESALEYIGTLVKFLENSENKPLFFKDYGTKIDPLLESLGKIYENGEVYFGIDENLYQGYREVLNGSRDMEEYIREVEPKLKIYFNE